MEIENQETPETPPEELSPPEIPPTNQQPNQVTDPRLTTEYINLIEGTLRESNRKQQELEAKLGQVQNQQQQQAPQLSQDEQRTRFFENPEAQVAETTRRIIREELGESIRELKEFTGSMRSQTIVDQLVAKARVNPRFQTMWDSNVEAMIRQEAGRIPPANLNDDNFNFLVVSAIGMKAIGQLPGSEIPNVPQPIQNQQVPQNQRTVPPHIRPSAPAAPRNMPKSDADVILTAEEERLLREYNSGRAADKKMSRARYKELQSLPDSQVVGGQTNG